jgi:hypothetical protein
MRRERQIKVDAPSELVRDVNVTAPMPFLIKGKVADSFDALRQKVQEAVGYDFLATCGDIMRSKAMVKVKAGAATKSFHKCGVAFDYNQADTHLVLEFEEKDGKLYWRTFLKCASQDGSMGIKKKIKTSRGEAKPKYVEAFVVDFTQMAEDHGFGRIPAHSDWQSNWNGREFWHYEHKETVANDWLPLMRMLYPGEPDETFLGSAGARSTKKATKKKR